MGINETFKALSDPMRRQILILLRNGSMTAGALAEKLDMTPAALSYHLKTLKNAELLLEYRRKNFIYYELNSTLFDDLVLWLKEFGGYDDEKQHKEKDTVDGSSAAFGDNSGNTALSPR